MTVASRISAGGSLDSEIGEVLFEWAGQERGQKTNRQPQAL